MKAQMKAVMASAVVIVLALAAVSGVTYSWFSDYEEGEITVTTGKINADVAMEIMSTFSFQNNIENVKQENNNFSSGGSSEVKGKEAILKSIVPGDGFVLKITGTVTSDISTKYRFTIDSVNGLDIRVSDSDPGMNEITIEGQKYSYFETDSFEEFTSNYYTGTNGAYSVEKYVFIGLPISYKQSDVLDQYKITIGFEAVQSNIASWEVDNESDLRKACEIGGDITLTKDINLSGGLELKNDVTFIGNGKTISGNRIIVSKNVDATFENLSFNGRNEENFSIIYTEDYYVGKLTINNCTFRDAAWDALQILPDTGAEITINGCEFFKNCSSDEAFDTTNRYIHIQAYPSLSNNVGVTITNNYFGSTSNFNDNGNNAMIDVDYINFEGVRVGQNVFEDYGLDSDIYVCNSDGTVVMENGIAIKLFTGEISSTITFNSIEEKIDGVKIDSEGNIISDGTLTFYKDLEYDIAD